MSTPAARHSATLARRSSVVMLSSRTRSAPASSTSRTCSTVSHSTSTGTPGKRSRTAAKAAATPPAATTWLSLTSAASDSDMRWLTPPPQRTACFSSARRPGVVLRVSRMRAPVPATASHPGGGERGDAGQVAQQVERRALGGEQRPHRARRPPAPPARAPPRSPSVASARSSTPGTTTSSDGHGDADAGERPVGAGDERRDAAQVGGHGRDRRDVLPAVEVLGDRPADEVEDGGRVEAGARERGGGGGAEGHACSRGSYAVPRRVVTRWPRQASSASGWSSRQWAPRVSSRRAAAATSAVATVCRSVASHAAGDGSSDRRAPSASSVRAAAASDVGAAQHAGAEGHRRRRARCAPTGRAAAPRRRAAPARPAAAATARGPRRCARRTPAPRAGCCWPAGWRRGRRCRRPRRRRTGPGTSVRPSRSVRTPPLA